MSKNRNFIQYHQSIAEELTVTQNRIRDLIGNRHWLTDGERKEAAFRKVLRNHIPERFHVGKGFVCFEKGTSNQIDILITDKNHPVLFKDGELRIVTPDAVRAIIEVKTRIRGKSELVKILNKISDDAEKIRNSGITSDCWAGLFAYNERGMPHDAILSAIREAAKKSKDRAINCVAMGPNQFTRFWKQGSLAGCPIPGPVWYSYKLENLAFSYFIGNLVVDYLSWQESFGSESAWYPLTKRKEPYQKGYIGLNQTEATTF